MEFRTVINIAPPERRIDHSQRGLSIGSCFAENIASKMSRAKFPVVSNPFGVLYNPMSIADALERLDAKVAVADEELVQGNGLWCSFSFHGSFSSPERATATEAMNNAIGLGAEALAKADYVIVTFGTAWVFERGELVAANCHKFPAAEFARRRLGVGEIVDRYSRLMDGALRGKRVIFTVSPVRHIKDGLPENSISKATLLLAIDKLVGKYPDAACYFPSYEIVNDDLRDYRFYKSDMVHPSDAAVEYIWELFGKNMLTPEALAAAREAEKIAAAKDHRPLNSGTDAHRAFRHSMAARVADLAKTYPHIDWSAEEEYFKTI